MTLHRVIAGVLAAGAFFWAARWISQPLPPSGHTGTRTVQPGVVHTRTVDATGPWVINVTEVDLRRSELRVEAVCAQDSYLGREPLSTMAARRTGPERTVVAALNGDYFNPVTGEVQNNQMVNGRFVKAFQSPGARPDLVDIPNSQFAFGQDRRPRIGQFRFRGALLWTGGATEQLAGVNIIPRRGGFTVFNAFRGASTPLEDGPAELLQGPLTVVRTAGDTTVCLPAGPLTAMTGAQIPPRGLVLAGYGAARERLAGLWGAPEDTLRIIQSLEPDTGPVRQLVGGWPWIVKGGVSIFRMADFPENPSALVFSRRHPRSAIGFSRDSTRIYLVTVDGRSSESAGMSLPELADLLVRLGVDQGLNLDGGGSTTMLVGGEIVNTPSDPTGERPVGNGILIVAGRTGAAAR